MVRSEGGDGYGMPHKIVADDDETSLEKGSAWRRPTRNVVENPGYKQSAAIAVEALAVCRKEKLSLCNPVGTRPAVGNCGTAPAKVNIRLTKRLMSTS
jgi:hypothetical protein